MKKILAMVLASILMASSANAVTIVIYSKVRNTAVDRPELVGLGLCFDSSTGEELVQYINDQTNCEGAGNIFASELSDGVAGRGDIISIHDDPYNCTGALECIPPVNGGHFVRIRVTDKTKAQAEKYLEPYIIGTRSIPKRKWKALVDDLPAGVKTQLNQTGYYENDWATIKGYIYDKINQVTE